MKIGLQSFHMEESNRTNIPFPNTDQPTDREKSSKIKPGPLVFN